MKSYVGLIRLFEMCLDRYWMQVEELDAASRICQETDWSFQIKQ